MMDFIKANWKVIVIVTACVLAGYASVLYLGKDNVIEQEAEKVIELETGIKVDLTP